MTANPITLGQPPQTPQATKGAGPRVASPRLDVVMLIFCSWPLFGGYLDAWAHHHVPNLETFFTPWHGVLYSGFLAAALAHAVLLLSGRRAGYDWRHALPSGYGLSALGVLAVFIGGPGDLLWHTLFGIEQDFNAAVSPTHMLLALAIGLVVSGPLRSMWRKPAPARWITWLPALLALTATLSAITLVTQYAHPFDIVWAAPAARTTPDDFGQELGVLNVILQSAILMGFVLAAIRRWRLPFGALTLLLTLNAVALAFMDDRYIVIPVALLAGLIGDVLLAMLQPSLTRTRELRVFAFTLPAVLYLFYFAGLELTTGIWWQIHVWLGAVVLAGVAGWLLSYLVAPPVGPVTAA